MLKRLLVLTGLLLLVVSSFACEIYFNVSEKYKKESYTPGEEIVVELKVVLVHHHCDIGIQDTKISADGATITGATKWNETKPGVFERKLKVKIDDTPEKDFKLKCQRTCEKEGGYGELKLKKE